MVSVKFMMWSCDGSLEVEEMADLLTCQPDVDDGDNDDDGDDVDDDDNIDDVDDVLFSVLLRLRRWQTITFLPATLSPLWIQPPSSANTPNDTPHCFIIHHGKDKQTVPLS